VGVIATTVPLVCIHGVVIKDVSVVGGDISTRLHVLDDESATREALATSMTAAEFERFWKDFLSFFLLLTDLLLTFLVEHFSI